MVVNKFMCDNIMIKNKTLPLYEQGGVYNLKKRKYKNIDTLHEYNMMTQVLTKNVRCGSLWDTIKNIFKKGKDIAKKTFNFIDNSPLLNVVKDIGFDYIQDKTGINPNQYYNIAREVANNDTNVDVQHLTNTAAKTLADTYQRYKQDRQNQKKNPNFKGPTKKEQLTNIMRDFKNNLTNSYPQYKNTITSNYNAFANGIDKISSGSINLDVWKKKAPLFLLSTISQKGNGKLEHVMPDKFRELLKDKFNLSDFRLPPTMRKILEGNLPVKIIGSSSGNELSSGKDSGRLYMGHGDENVKDSVRDSGRLHIGHGEEKSGKKANEKYAKLLAALK